MTSEMKTIRRSLEDASSFEQFKANFLSDIGCGHAERPAMDRTREIRRLLSDVGVQDHLLGHPYIEFAVNMVLDDRSCIENITGALYPAIASKFGTTTYRVERAIRHAIENAFDNCDHDELVRYFGNTISLKSGKVPNSQFISRMANIIRDRM